MNDRTTNEAVIPVALSDALCRIERLHEPATCAGLIGAIKNAARSLQKQKQVVYLATYPFGSHIIENGTFRFPPGCAPHIEGLDDQVPLCVVAKNIFEVYRPCALDWRKIDAPRSLRLLHPGESFGVFELSDWLCAIARRKEETYWAVSAGTRTARLLYPLNNWDVKTFLRDELRTTFGDINKITTRESDLEEFTWHLMVAWSQRHQLQWSAQALVFPRWWLEGAESQRLKFEVLRAAWLQGQDDRLRAFRKQTILEGINQSPELTQMTEHKEIRAEDAAQLLLCIDDVTSGRSVAHVLSSEAADQYVASCGPFHKILGQMDQPLREIRREHELLGVVAVPKHLAPGDSGFISLSRPTSHFAIFKPSRDEPLGEQKSSTTRMTRLLREAGTAIEAAQDFMEHLIPGANWDAVTFYGHFQKKKQALHGPSEQKIPRENAIELEDDVGAPRCERRSALLGRCGTDAANVQKRIHTRNTFFLQCVEVRRHS